MRHEVRSTANGWILHCAEAEPRSAEPGEPFAFLRWLPLSDADLSKVDPLEMNLVVAKGIPSLAHLDIARYARQCDEWAAGVAERLHAVEPRFWQTPDRWKNDIRFFRLVILAEFVALKLGIAYNEDQRENKGVYYTDPATSS